MHIARQAMRCLRPVRTTWSTLRGVSCMLSDEDVPCPGFPVGPFRQRKSATRGEREVVGCRPDTDECLGSLLVDTKARTQNC